MKKIPIITLVVGLLTLGGIKAEASWLIDARKFHISAHGQTPCVDCHEDMADTPHPVPTHPISGVPDPSRPGKELTCSSCHDPHGSDHSSLLYQEGYGICKRCHNK